MMSGLPCVASDVGDVRLALDGAGLVVPPEDPAALAAALQELVASPERRRELGAAAHARARDRFSVEKMVAETVQVYDAATSDPGELAQIPTREGIESTRHPR
jgi:glycosyltransferase involved in cell wall biosynthesis